MSDFQELLDESSQDRRSKDVKYNIFLFQDHILDWIKVINRCMFEMDYEGAIRALDNLYTDCIGFLDDKEIEELDPLMLKAERDTNEYRSYVSNVSSIPTKKNLSYSPPSNHYRSIKIFRRTLMKSLCKHQLLIPVIKKGAEGAASD